MSDSGNQKKKICLACGGSAGHIFPGLTLAEELKRRYGENVEISFLTSDNKLAHSILGGSRFSFYALPVKGLKKGNLRQNLDFISSLFKGMFEAVKIIFLNRPDCFVGFGSYVAGPPFVVASLLGVPTLIHEQNAVMGKANRLMRLFATKVALSFPEREGRRNKNVIFTGNPIRESAANIYDKIKARDLLGIARDKFTILVMGGSQGSRTINSMTIEMLKCMQGELRKRIQLVHISGEADYERLKENYEKIDVLCKIHSFFKDMGIIYSAADISISRAGASVVYELCVHKIPSILIPYPFAESHQVQNAKFLLHKEAVIMIEESALSATLLREKVEELMGNEGLRKSMSEKMGALVTSDAARRLADEVSALL